MNEEELFQKHLPKPAISKLKQLVDSCNVFDHPDKLEALRKEKLSSTFCKDEEELSELRSEVSKSGVVSGGGLDACTSRLLQEWLTDISLSEFLFRRKYDPSKKIVEQMHDNESESEGDPTENRISINI